MQRFPRIIFIFAPAESYKMYSFKIRAINDFPMKKRSFTTFIFACTVIGASVAQSVPSPVDTVAPLRGQYNLQDVVVTGTRNETDKRHLPMTITVVDNEQIRYRYDQSLLPVLNEQVPGFFSTSRGVLGYGVAAGGSGGMKIRGIGGNPTTGLLVLIDGHPQYMGLMGHPLADAYQSMLADKVEVLRGPASVLYGSNAMGGVVNIVSRKLQMDGRHTDVRVGYGSYNTLTTEAINRYRKGRFNNVTTASYNRTDGHRTDMEFEQYSGYTRFGYDFSQQWKAFADANITHFNASNPGTIDKPIIDNDSRITRGVTSVSLENEYERTSGALKFYYNWGEHKINDGYSPGGQPLDFRFNSRDKMLGVTWYQTASFFEGNRFTFGVDYQHFGGEAWNKYPDKRNELADRSENEVAGYISLRQAIGRILTLDAGIRLDHHSRTGSEWIPQGGLALQLPRSAELRAMVSKGFRNPTIRELYMFPPQNADLLPEELMSYEISYSQRLLDNALSYGLNVFYIDGKNMIDQVRIDGRPRNVNIDKVKNWGVEANVAYHINQSWRINGNYSWLRIKYPIQGTPKHKLYAGVDYTKNKWRISSGLQYINGIYTNTDVEPATTDSFVLWNLRAGYQVHKIVNLFVKGENLLAQQYEINAGYPMPKATVMAGVNLSF